MAVAAADLRQNKSCEGRLVKHGGVTVEMAQKCCSDDCVMDTKYLAQLRQNVTTVQRRRKYATNSNVSIVLSTVLSTD